MAHSTKTPDLGQAHGRTPDRGAPSGHTPADRAETQSARRQSTTPDNADPSEKARPRDTDRSGA